jgi:hypothetical protein
MYQQVEINLFRINWREDYAKRRKTDLEAANLRQKITNYRWLKKVVLCIFL